MNDTNDTPDVLLRVPFNTAKRLEELAEKRGISGRSPWAICARMVLKEALEKEVEA